MGRRRHYQGTRKAIREVEEEEARADEEEETEAMAAEGREIAGDAPDPVTAQVHRDQIDLIIERFGDGKAHSVTAIANALGRDKALVETVARRR